MNRNRLRKYYFEKQNIFSEGDKVGTCYFVNETAPYVWKKHKYRKGIFECGFCGRHFSALITSVLSGNTRSCGCLIKRHNGRKTHGMAGTKLYKRWQEAKERCYKYDHPKYPQYGKRGIGMCEEWTRNYESFYYYMMALPNAMRDGYSIDRINNDGDYRPGNMKWSTALEQANNKGRYKGNNKYTGVHKHENKWRAVITYNKKTKHIGLFNIEEKAVRARNDYILNNNLPLTKLNKLK